MTALKEAWEDKEASEKHRSDWIKAEYETMGWVKKLDPVDVAVEPLIKEGK